MADFVVNLITDYGYLGMFLGMVLEAVIIIIPSEVILATGGILASRGIFTFIGSFITGLLGSVFCFFFRGIYSTCRDIEDFCTPYIENGFEKIFYFFFGSLINKNKKVDENE